MVSAIWTKTASDDIENIIKYIGKDSILYADQFIKKLIASTLKLEKYPEIGRPLKELPQTDYKEILFKKYRIIYRFDSKYVYIITVHHSSRLLENNDTFRDSF